MAVATATQTEVVFCEAGGPIGLSVLSSGHATSAGMVRQHNEDSLCVHPEIGLWAVADGMGGYRSGETASRITVEQLARDVAGSIPIAESISRIHQHILTLAQSDPGYESMGSTVVALKTDGKKYEIAWVGDSRAYLWDGGKLTRLTRDHSYVQLLVDSGIIGEADALDHPERHVITQALGAEEIEGVDVDSIHGVFHENEKILLCSDGLTNEVPDSEISSILKQPLSEQGMVDRLIEAANQNGGSDNVSAILIAAENAFVPKGLDVETGNTQAAISRPDSPKGNSPFWILMVIVFFALFISVILVYDIL